MEPILTDVDLMKNNGPTKGTKKKEMNLKPLTTLIGPVAVTFAMLPDLISADEVESARSGAATVSCVRGVRA